MAEVAGELDEFDALGAVFDVAEVPVVVGEGDAAARVVGLFALHRGVREPAGEVHHRVVERPPDAADPHRDDLQARAVGVVEGEDLPRLLERFGGVAGLDGKRIGFAEGALREAVVDGDGGREGEAFDLGVAGGLEDADEAVHIDPVVLAGAEGGDAGDGEVDDVLRLVLLGEFLDDAGLGDVGFFDDDALAELVFDEGGLAPGLVVGDDDVLARVHERFGRVQADEPHSAGDENRHLWSPPLVLAFSARRAPQGA